MGRPHDQAETFLVRLTSALGAVIDKHPRAQQVAICSSADVNSHPLEVQEAQIVGEELAVNVAYAGGCKPHAFRLCWDGNFGESDPVHARLWLVHETTDTCEALRTDVLGFDLRPLQTAHEHSSPGAQRVIRLGIQDAPSTELRYAF